MKTWLKKGISLKSAALLALPVALLLVIIGGTLSSVNPAHAQTATGSVATAPAPAQTTPPPGNYDADGDKLIEISNLAQLNAIRWDLDGDGTPSGNASEYAAAFPVATSGSVCPADVTCAGYELTANLDFDTGAAGDRTDDTYHNSGSGWQPIGDDSQANTPVNDSVRYNAVFEGNGNTVTNLFINRGSTDDVGLFGAIGTAGVVRNLGVAGASVTGRQYVGALAGSSYGSVSHSYASGTVSGSDFRIGGLVGWNSGLISHSYATAAVNGQGTVGGLVGWNNRRIVASYAIGPVTGSDPLAGGLVGFNDGTGDNEGRIIASYATGPVTGHTWVGGLLGQSHKGEVIACYATGPVTATSAAPVNVGGLVGGSLAATFSDNYSDSKTTGRVFALGNDDDDRDSHVDQDTDDNNVLDAGETFTPGVTPKTTTELQGPTGYNGIYANWENIDLDGDGTTDAEDTNDFWDFGTDSQYPALKADFDGDGTATWQEFGYQFRVPAVVGIGSVATDRAALVALYYATGGDNWTNNTNWLSDKPVGAWHGVTTRINDGRVTGLDLSENNLSGRIPAELEGLKLLIELSLHRNQLAGPIPSQLASMDNLQQLHLSRNNLTGEIPAFLGGMTSLSRLHLNHNGFTGAVPAELGNRATLTSLLLQSNPGLTGKLPQSLTGMTGLQRFHFQDTGLCYPKGTSLATWIAGVSDVKGNDCERAALVALYHATDGDNWTNNTNWLSDQPVGEWHGVSFGSGTSRVRNLVLPNNNLSGTIPVELSDLAELRNLNLSGNNLTGEIPPGLGNTNVVQLSLNDNNLSGRLPSALFEDRVYPAYPHHFRDLDLRDNSGLTGPLPRSLMDANPAYTLLFTGTGLCAPADAEFQTWLNGLLAIGENRVTLDQNCTDRQILTAFYEDTGGANWTNKANWLSDRPIGEWHGVTTNDAGRVTQLSLAENNLTGQLPDYLASLTELTELALQKNSLSGEIPPQLGQFERLETFYLSRNNLTGEIPAEFGGLESLSRLHLNNNGFTGAVPTELGNLSNLTSLLLYGNTDLSGDLPQSLTGLANVWRIHFQDTGLCAPPNAGFQQWLGNVSDKIGDNCANRDRDALVALYNATDGANWHNNTNWLSDQPVGEWYGIDTDKNGNVDVMLLQNNNLRGTIPAEMGDFANLRIHSFNGNWLTGAIPAELGNLTSLTSMSLSLNLLSGEVPAELGKLTNLTNLSMYSNRGLVGTLPASFAALEQLEGFRHDKTGLCAPYDYQFLQWLEGLDLHLGEVCAPASDKDVLTLLYHSTNGDSWTTKTNWLSDQPLDDWHGVGTNDDGRVDFVSLGRNNLSGTIPSRLSDLSELKELYLNNSNLTGEIPADLGSLSKLERLHLYENRLTGEIPSELGNLQRIITLNLRDNDLSGKLPSGLGQNSSGPLWELAVQNNSGLTGPLPRSFTALNLHTLLFGGPAFAHRPTRTSRPGSMACMGLNRT